MTQITTIKPDGSAEDSRPMNKLIAKLSLFILKRIPSGNIYVMHTY